MGLPGPNEQEKPDEPGKAGCVPPGTCSQLRHQNQPASPRIIKDLSFVSFRPFDGRDERVGRRTTSDLHLPRESAPIVSRKSQTVHFHEPQLLRAPLHGQQIKGRATPRSGESTACWESSLTTVKLPKGFRGNPDVSDASSPGEVCGASDGVRPRRFVVMLAPAVESDSRIARRNSRAIRDRALIPLSTNSRQGQIYTEAAEARPAPSCL
jgi:hypothetical protein